jgi:hypothetical protein
VLPLLSFSVVKELFNRNVDTVNSKDANSNTPLHLACKAGSCKVAEFIIESQVADVEARYIGGICIVKSGIVIILSKNYTYNIGMNNTVD